jgi:hypothetical protein
MKNGVYEDKDFVEVVDAHGNALRNRVPKAWIGTDLLPEGTKQARATRQAQQPSGGSGSGDGGSGTSEVPAKSENRDVLEQFATEHAGMTAEQAAGYQNKDELHAAIVEAVSKS